MADGRKAALKVLDRCFRTGAWSQQTISSVSKDLDERETALASHLALGVLQNYRLLDYNIDSFLTGRKKLDGTVRNILRLGAYQILFSDRIPVHAAVSESVSLCRTAGYSSASGLVNAVLRKIAAGGVRTPDDLAVRFSHPDWFVDRMISRHGRAFTEALLEADNAGVCVCWTPARHPAENPLPHPC